MSSKVWVLQMKCPDYYCGCGGGHIVGIYETEESAQREAEELDLEDWNRQITEVILEVTKPYKLEEVNKEWTTGSWT